MKNTYLILILIFGLGTISCKKEAGEGGTSTINGKVWTVKVNGSGDTTAQYDAWDQDVYIIYGTDDLTYDDKFSTSLDGSYTFTNLTIGTYTIFTYSECDFCVEGLEIVQRTVEITDKKQVVEVETMNVIE